MIYGPVDFLALEFKGNQFKGEIIPAILELVQNKIIRVIDLIVIRKNSDGTHQAFEMEQLDAETVRIFDPLELEISGIIQVEDIEMIAGLMENNTTAGLILFENLWAIKFGEAAQRANGRMVMFDRIPFEAVNEALETFTRVEMAA
ncbi:MAG: DUF1269 domain-containing protein [Anaerolineae bacterium]|nr:DUF1269 domain-containing protein [Anaerolineae bacterium]